MKIYADSDMDMSSFPEGQKLFMGNLEAIKHIDLNNHTRLLHHPYFTEMTCTYFNTFNKQKMTETLYRHNAKGRFWTQALHYDWVACSVKEY